MTKEAMTQKMYDIFDEVVEASQDPNNHPGFEQLRRHLRENVVSIAGTTPRVHTNAEAAQIREDLRQIEAVNALEGIKPSLELRELYERVIRGEVTQAQGFIDMKAKLFEKHGITNVTSL